MVNSLSYRIAHFFCERNIIPKDEMDSYAYGYQIMLIAMINWSVILLIMLITGSIYITLLYMSSIIFLRHHTGGYHAGSHFKCFILSLVAYLIILIICHFAPDNIGSLAAIFFMLFADVAIFKFAPIVHKNNPVKASKVKKHRRYSLILSSIFSMMGIIFLLLRHNTLSLSLSLGMFQVSISLLIEHFINKRRGGGVQ